MGKKLYEESDVHAIADAIREKNGMTTTYKVSEMAGAVSALTMADTINHADIPEYVKTAVVGIAKKVSAVRTASSIVFITISDPHHATDETTGWKAKIEQGNLDACRAIKALAFALPLDFVAFLGDLTFGYRTTTKEQFLAQCKEFHKWIDEGFRDVDQFWAVGNHDTGEYLAGEWTQSDGTVREEDLTKLYGADTIYPYFGAYNEAVSGMVMGSTSAGYCYKDFTSKKLRVICLNTVEGELTSGESDTTGMSNAQLLWFAQTLYSLGSKSDAASWGCVVLGHYPLDWGWSKAGGNILKAYLDGGSVTFDGSTVDFSGANSATIYGNFHGHLHNYNASKIYIVPDDVSASNPPTAQMDVLRVCCPSSNYYRTNEVGENERLDSNQIEFGDADTPSKSDGVEDTAFCVNVINPSEKIIYSFAYGAGYDRTLSFDFVVVMHSISMTLTGCSISNPATAVEDGGSYAATLTPDSGYVFGSVIIMMGGTDITSTAYNDGEINIAQVTGDIVITAAASKPVTYTNLVPTAVDSTGASMPYQDGYSLNSSGELIEDSTITTTGFIPLADNVVKHIYRIAGAGISFSKSEPYNRIAWYDSSFNKLAVLAANKVDFSEYFPSSIEESTTSMTINVRGGDNTPTSAAYFRVAATGKGENLIVTLDEPIE